MRTVNHYRGENVLSSQNGICSVMNFSGTWALCSLRDADEPQTPALKIKTFVRFSSFVFNSLEVLQLLNVVKSVRLCAMSACSFTTWALSRHGLFIISSRISRHGPWKPVVVSECMASISCFSSMQKKKNSCLEVCQDSPMGELKLVTKKFHCELAALQPSCLTRYLSCRSLSLFCISLWMSDLCVTSKVKWNFKHILK